MSQKDYNYYLLNASLHILPGWKFVIDKQGIIVNHYNAESNTTILDVEIEELMGQSIGVLFPPYLTNAILVNITNALSLKEKQIFEFALPYHNELRYFKLSFQPILDEDVLLIIEDVSACWKAKEEFSTQKIQLEQQNTLLKKYEDSNAQLEKFAYVASHDLREPLRTIRNFADLLIINCGDELSEKAKFYLDFIVGSVGQMNNLIEDLLTYSRVNTQNHDIKVIELPQLLETVKQSLGKSLNETNGAINIGNIPTTIKGNNVKIKQLFQNLLANSIKFRKENEPPIIDISATETEQMWIFAVKDNGIGIKEEYQEQIFMLFKKLFSSTDYPGTGLGLAICKKIVEQHGGQIWVESEEGEGATFFFSMVKDLGPVGELI